MSNTSYKIYTVNHTGLAEIARILNENHKKFIDSPLSTDPAYRQDAEILNAWAADVENSADENGRAEFEIKSWDSLSGRTELHRLSQKSLDVEEKMENVMYTIQIEYDAPESFEQEIRKMLDDYRFWSPNQAQDYEIQRGELMAVCDCGEVGEYGCDCEETLDRQMLASAIRKLQEKFMIWDSNKKEMVYDTSRT